jgi:hypothetical protein
MNEAFFHSQEWGVEPLRLSSYGSGEEACFSASKICSLIVRFWSFACLLELLYRRTLCLLIELLGSTETKCIMIQQLVWRDRKIKSGTQYVGTFVARLSAKFGQGRLH